MCAFVWCGSFDIHLGGLTGCCILLGSVTACRFRLGGLTARVVFISVVLDVMCRLSAVLFCLTSMLQPQTYVICLEAALQYKQIFDINLWLQQLCSLQPLYYNIHSMNFYI